MRGMVAQVQEPNKHKKSDQFAKWRAKGAEMLDYWAACEKSRLDNNPDHAGLYAEAVPSDLAGLQAQGATGSRGGLPTDLSAPTRRYLEVETAFKSIAAHRARELFGKSYDELSLVKKIRWDRFVAESSACIRGLCYHILVLKSPAGFFIDEYAEFQMAKYGVSRKGFARWLGQRVDDVREFLGRHG